MGKGSTTTQTNVVKKQRQYSSDAGAVAAAGGANFDRETANACLISFTEKINFSEAAGILKSGLQFVIVAENGRTLQMISGARKLGAYRGQRASLLRQCIAAGYIYRGSVQSIENETTAVCTITGLGRI